MAEMSKKIKFYDKEKLENIDPETARIKPKSISGLDVARKHYLQSNKTKMQAY